MDKIIEILMKRDGMTYEEAKELFLEVQEMILHPSTTYSEVEDIMYTELRLEMDYLDDIIFT